MSRRKEQVRRGAATNGGLEAQLRTRMAGFSRAERAIASYLLDNMDHVPFETGASIAAEAGVSQMTLLRFLRLNGYANLKQLKQELRRRIAADDELDDVLERFKVRPAGEEGLRESLGREVRAIVKAYALTVSPAWPEIVTLLAQARSVFVVGFQASEGMARDFATRLLYARPNVSYVENISGTFAEVLEADPKSSALVLVDTVSYARRSQKLAAKIRESGMPLVIVTDKFSHWGTEHTPFVLEGHTETQTFWDSSASLVVILNLLINGVATRLGKRAERRFESLRKLGDFFEEFSRSQQRSGR
jgi:DNA-binding MurR/RpiR family transcriptional regulator